MPIFSPFNNQAGREAVWEGVAQRRDERHAALQTSRNELQARFDWLLHRWKAREPRQADQQVESAVFGE